MKKNIQNSIDSNWKSYQAVAQANIQSLEDLEIISYTRFNSSTRLYVGDDILVNNKLARIGTVFVDEVYGHRYSISYPEMSLGHEEIIFTIEWVLDVSILPEDNNIVGFKLEQVDTTELVIDVVGDITSLKVTPYKTLVTPNDIVDDIDNIFQSEFKGTDTIDVESTESGAVRNLLAGEVKLITNLNFNAEWSGTLLQGIKGETLSSDLHPEINLFHSLADTLLTQVLDAGVDAEIKFGPFSTVGASTDSFKLSSSNDGIEWLEEYTVGHQTVAEAVLHNVNFQSRFVKIESLTKTDVGNGHEYTRICIGGLLDMSYVDVIKPSNTLAVIEDYQLIGNNVDGIIAVNGVEQIVESTNDNITTYTLQTVDTDTLNITTDGTFDSINYTTTISTPTEIVTDISKTITQDVQQENWTKYQLKARELDGTVTVNGVEQVVESVDEIIVDTITVDESTDLSSGVSWFIVDGYGGSGTGLVIQDDYAGDTHTRMYNSCTLHITLPAKAILTGTTNMNLTTDWTVNNHAPVMSPEGQSGLCVLEAGENVLFAIRTDGDPLFTGLILKPFESSRIDNILATQTTFTEQLVDTNTLDISVSGTVERIDTTTYINEDIITTIQDTDSITDLTISDFPYTLTQEVDQTNFNNYLISTIGLEDGANVTVNGVTQTIEIDIEGVCSLETSNDLFDIVRTFDYKAVAKENIFSDFIFNSPTTFRTMEDIELGQQLLLDNLNFASLDSKEIVTIKNDSVTETISFIDTTTVTNTTENWLDYKMIATEIVGDLIVNGLTQTVESEEEIEVINFDILFQNGIDMGADINYDTNEIYGYRVDGTSGTPGRYSMNMQDIYDTGCRELKFNVTSGANGAIYIGRFVNGEILDHDNVDNTFYNTGDIDYTLNLETKVLSFVVNGTLDDRFITVPDFTNTPLSEIVIGISAIQSTDGWTQWSVTPFTKTITTFEKVETDTNELLIEGSCESLDYSTSTLNHLQPEYTVTHQDYSRVEDNGIVSHNFVEAAEAVYTDENLPSTMKSFEFPTLSVSYYDIDDETTVGPIEKEYNTINISEDRVIFDYNDETKANTNKIDFNPTGIKEIVVSTKKIQEDI